MQHLEICCILDNYSYWRNLPFNSFSMIAFVPVVKMLILILKPSLLLISLYAIGYSSCLRISALKFFPSVTAFFFFFILSGLGQKPVIDTTALRNWKKVDDGNISNDGRFVTYNISYTEHTNGNQFAAVVQSCVGKWKKSFHTATTSIIFSPDAKIACLILSYDSLAILTLGTDNISYIKDVASFQIVSGYLLCTSNNDPSRLSVIGISDKKTEVLDSIVQYEYDEKKNSLILLKKGVNRKQIISYYNLASRIVFDFWEGDILDGYYFDKVTGNFAFIGKGNYHEKGIWNYHSGDRNAAWIISENDIGIDTLTAIRSIHGFSKDRDKLFVVAKPTERDDRSIDVKFGSKVTIWSYTDARLKSQDERNAREIPEYFYVIDLANKRSIPINKSDERIIDISDDYALIRHFSGRGDMQEVDWNPRSQFRTMIVSFKDGKHSNLPIENPVCSKAGHFLLYFDPIGNDYFTYNLSTDSIVNITHKITSGPNRASSSFYKNEFTRDWDYQTYWLENDSALVLYAERDIWLLDPLGSKTPVNITNGFGAKNNVVFYPVGEFSGFRFKKGEELILSGFNFLNKKNGFYKIRWRLKDNPKELIMDDCVYFNPHVNIHYGYENRPIKATNANIWLIRKMSDRESPNYFITSNFRTFSPVSNVYSEKEYNWIISELHTWKSFNNDSIQGVLYKPENFINGKKYPIIFFYYEQFSNNLHSYFIPETFKGPINIPYMVSQGYLVFVPDIHYKLGETGVSAYNSIASAARYMSTMPYVDPTRMGIQGHSFGGYETNFILTKTNMFAAACSASGITDLIAFAGGISAQGKSMHWMTNKGQIRLNIDLWKDPQRYIDNSPLFFLDKVTTPLLVMHTTDDIAVPFGQALELFNALRIFRKKVWMLIYKGENHILRDRNNAYDYTIRQIQFFDYYLKGYDLPIWMKPLE